MNSIIYYFGTNKLQRVTGSGTQYTYDHNGNMTTDDLNSNYDIIYDHRNLIIELIDLFPFPIGDVKTKVNSNQLLP